MIATQPQQSAFRAGVVAAVVMTGVTLLLRLTLGIRSVPEMLADGTVSLVPPFVFASVLALLESAAKRLLLVGVVAGQLVAGGLLGLVYVRWWLNRRPTNRRNAWTGSFGLAALVWLATGFVLLPLFGAGIFGASYSAGPIPIAASTLGAYAVYAVFLVLTLRAFGVGERSLEDKLEEPASPGRRDM